LVTISVCIYDSSVSVVAKETAAAGEKDASVCGWVACRHPAAAWWFRRVQCTAIITRGPWSTPVITQARRGVVWSAW